MTFGVGAVGFVVFRLLKIPNPALLGAMFCTGLMNIAGLYPAFPLWPVSFSANVVIGVMLGRQIDRNLISRIRDLALYVVSMTVGLMLLSLLCGLTFFKFADVSLKTALVATSAGGITEMMIFGMSINADLSIVACLQLFRVVIFLTLIPFISVLDKGKSNRPQWKSPENLSPADCFSKVDYVLLTFVAFIGAGIAAYFKIPTGAMLGAMVASGIFAVVIKKSHCYDARLRFAAQIGLGVVMGQRMTYAMISQLGEILAPALLTTAVMLAGSIALAFLLRRLSGWDMLTCLLCAAPAGLSQITAFAEEIGVDSFTASVFHTVRILSIVIIYPWIILWAI
jgi:membrane AbrB-like protein